MNETVRKAQIALRAQGLLVRAQTRHVVQSIVLLAVALVFFVAAIAVLDLAAFTALSTLWGPVEAGLVVGGSNLAVGVGLLRLAGRAPRETEEMKMARELSEVSLSALSDDLNVARDELRAFSHDVRRLRSAVGLVTSAVGMPLQLLLRALSDTPDDAMPSGQKD